MSNSRKSVAAQFFMDEDSGPPGESTSEQSSRHVTPEPGTTDESQDSAVQLSSISSRELIVELINEASTATDASEKLEALRKVQELLVHKEPVLLDNFLDEMMGFQKDRSQEVRKGSGM